MVEGAGIENPAQFLGGRGGGGGGGEIFQNKNREARILKKTYDVQRTYRQPYQSRSPLKNQLVRLSTRQSWLVCQSELRDALLSRAYQAVLYCCWFVISCPKQVDVSALNCYLMSVRIYNKKTRK